MLQALEKEVNVLLELGLTSTEARVYLALVQLGLSRIGAISENTGIHRANLYPTLRSLEEKSLIEKEVDAPTKYQAVPPQVVLPMLVRSKQSQVFDLETKAQQVAANLQAKQTHNGLANALEREENKFALIPGKDVLIGKMRKAIQEAQVSVDAATTLNRLSLGVVEFAEDYKDALRRGVKIQIAAEKHSVRATQKTLRALESCGKFEVRFFSSAADAVVWVVDGKEAAIMTAPNACLTGSSALWSSNSSFVAVVKSYFEAKWNSET